MRRLSVILIFLAGCAVQAEPDGQYFGAPYENAGRSPSREVPADSSEPSAGSGAISAAATTRVFEAGKVYFFCPPFPCPACDRIDSRYTKIDQPYPAGFEWVNDYGDEHGWPVMYWKGKTDWHRRVGYEGVEATERIVNPPRQPPMPQGYPIRGSWWTHPGDVWSHLMGPPHNFSADYVRTLSRAEAESLHSDDHEGRVKGNPPRGGVSFERRAYTRPSPKNQASRFRATGYYNCPQGST